MRCSSLRIKRWVAFGPPAWPWALPGARQRRDQGRRFAAWMVAALLFAFVLPALAMVLASGQVSGDPLARLAMEVCTPLGLQQAQPVSAAGEPEADGQTTAAGQAHCPLCRVVSDAPPDLSRADLRFAAPPPPPPLPPQALRPRDTVLRVVLSTPPRAPPLS